MATTTTWVIEWMQCKPTEGSYSDVVVTVGWRCNGTDGVYMSTAYGSCSFGPPEGNFTPYDQLTQDQVLGWCWDSTVNKAAVEELVTQQVEVQANPPVIQPPLPWA